MKQALLIVNPYSGKKDGVRVGELIREKLSGNGITARLFVSRGLPELEQFVRECAFREFDFLGLIGGDGTMHTFLNAVLQRFDEVPLPVALFPCGTGNAFNFDIRCNSIDHTLQNILANKCSYVDIAEIQCGSRRLWSFNIIGCGLVTEINGLAENLRFFGAARYTVASLVKLMANPQRQLKIRTDQAEFEGKFSFVLACNTRYTGKGMLMAPHARLNDGKFDVILVRACSAFKLLMLFPKIFKGKHLGADVLTYLQTEMLEVSSPKREATNIDGEMKGQTPFALRVYKNKLRVFGGLS